MSTDCTSLWQMLAFCSIRFFGSYKLATMRPQSSHPTLVRMFQCLRHVTSGTRELFREVAGVVSL